jgi:DNA polymerase III subunit gamma/tau
VRAGADPRTRLELALVKAARPELDGSVRALIARIERLEAGSPGAPAAGKAPAPPSPGAQAATGTGAEERARIASVAPATEPLAAPEVAPAPLAVDRAGPPNAPTGASSERGQAPVADLEAVLSIWPAVVELVRAEHALLGAVIADARPVALDGTELTLAFSATAQFYRKKAEDPANRAIVGEALRSLAPGRWRLSYELRDVPGDERPDAEELSEEALVTRFIDEFDAEEVPGDWLPEGHDGAADAETLAANEQGA